MQGKLKAQGSALSIRELEAVTRLVLEAEAQIVAEKAHQTTPRPVVNAIVTAVARRMQKTYDIRTAHGLIGLPDRGIDTVDFDTVFAALNFAASEAKADSAKRGLPVTGR